MQAFEDIISMHHWYDMKFFQDKESQSHITFDSKYKQ